MVVCWNCLCLSWRILGFVCWLGRFLCWMDGWCFVLVLVCCVGWLVCVCWFFWLGLVSWLMGRWLNFGGWSCGFVCRGVFCCWLGGLCFWGVGLCWLVRWLVCIGCLVCFLFYLVGWLVFCFCGWVCWWRLWLVCCVGGIFLLVWWCVFLCFWLCWWLLMLSLLWLVCGRCFCWSWCGWGCWVGWWFCFCRGIVLLMRWLRCCVFFLVLFSLMWYGVWFCVFWLSWLFGLYCWIVGVFWLVWFCWC